MAKADLHDIVGSAVEAVGYQLWGLEYIQAKGPATLRVFIDSPNGIDIEDCAQASRQISAILDVHDPISGEYNLEVSSPGLERPLFSLEQFKQYIGDKVKFVLYQAIQNKRRFRATITAVNDEDELLVVTAEDGDELSFSMADIAKANVAYELEGGKKHGK